jgi:hypothetical protein
MWSKSIATPKISHFTLRFILQYVVAGAGCLNEIMDCLSLFNGGGPLAIVFL